MMNTNNKAPAGADSTAAGKQECAVGKPESWAPMTCRRPVPRRACRSRAAKAALRRSFASTELLQLWHQAAVELKHYGAERDRLWQRLVEKIEPLLSARLRSTYRPDPVDCLDVEEVVQEVFLRLLRESGHAMRKCVATTDAQLHSYLARICESCLVDLMRYRRAKKRGFEATVRFTESDESQVADATLDIERLLICRSQLAGFGRAVRRCSLRSAHNARRNCWIFEQALMEGRQSVELSGELGLRPSSVDSVISRMRQDLNSEGWEVTPRYS